MANQGRQVGRATAQAVLQWRQNDGWPAVIAPGHLRAAAHCRIMATDAACKQFCDVRLRQRGARDAGQRSSYPSRRRR